MELWETFRVWFLGLGEQYGVNPVVFGTLYVGTMPLFTISLGWVIRNLRRNKPVFIPLILTGIFFISAYLYLIVVGKNIPTWVYVFIVSMIILGIVATIQKIRTSRH
jgi:drug/metabolite transporter (DMT)-like permease